MTFDPTNFDPGRHTDGGSDTLPPGEYVLTVSGFTRQFRKGKEQIDFTIKAVLNKSRNKVPQDYMKVWETATLTENAIWRFANLCKAVGQMDPFNVRDDRELAEAIKGKPFKARIVHETYNGRKNAKIKSYAELTESDRKAFDEAIEDMAMDEATGGYSESNDYSNSDYDHETQASQYSDDDIPF